MSFAFLASRNCSPNSVLFGDLFLHVNGLCPRMYGHRIAAAAAAATAAFRCGVSRIVEATVSRNKPEDSSFV